jgi:hypothetical protein
MTEVYIAFLLLVLLAAVILECIDGLMLLITTTRRWRTVNTRLVGELRGRSENSCLT